MPLVAHDNPTDECPICQELKAEENGSVWQLEPPCGHEFHRECLAQLLRSNSNSNCPLCRDPISVTDRSGIIGNPGTSDRQYDGNLRNPLTNIRELLPSRYRGDLERIQRREDRPDTTGGALYRDRELGQSQERTFADVRHGHDRDQHGGLGHRNSWECMIHEARSVTLQRFPPNIAEDPVTYAATDRLFDALAVVIPQPGNEPPFDELVEAFQAFLEGEDGIIEVDGAEVEWTVPHQRPSDRHTSRSPPSYQSRASVSHSEPSQSRHPPSRQSHVDQIRERHRYHFAELDRRARDISFEDYFEQLRVSNNNYQSSSASNPERQHGRNTDTDEDFERALALSAEEARENEDEQMRQALEASRRSSYRR